MFAEILTEASIAFVHFVPPGVYTYGTVAFLTALFYWRFQKAQSRMSGSLTIKTLPLTDEEKFRKKLIAEIIDWLNDKSKDALWVEKASEMFEKDFSENEDKRLLVIINPVAGHATAADLYNNNVHPVLTQCGFQHDNIEILLTERPGHATEHIQNLDLDLVDGILAVGGDGTQSETFRGLYLHPDQERALAVPVGVVPGGSGNHVCSVIDGWTTSQYHTGEPLDLVSVALRVVSGKTMPMDLLEMDLLGYDGNRIKDSSVVLFMMGDGVKMTVLSEKLRWTRLGMHRYTLAQMMMRYGGSYYEYDITYLPADSDEDVPSFEDWQETNNWKKSSVDKFSNVMLWSTISRYTHSMVYTRFKAKESMTNGFFYFIGARMKPGKRIPEAHELAEVKAVRIRSDDDDETNAGLQRDGEKSPTYFAKEARFKLCSLPATVFT